MWYARLIVLFGVSAMLLLAWQLGIFEQLSEPARVKQTLLSLGGWGYLAFIVSYALLQPFGFPGSVFIWSAPLIWPWPVAFALSMAGTQSASVVGFSFFRFLARDWVANKIPERFRRYEDALAKRELLTVFGLRFLFWMPPPLHAFFGVSKVSFSAHFWGSLAGYLLPLFLVSFFGDELFTQLRKLPIEAWVAVGALALLVGLGVFLWKRRAPSRAR